MKNTKKPLCGQCASGLVPGTPKTFDPACRGCVQKKDNGLRTGNEPLPPKRGGWAVKKPHMAPERFKALMTGVKQKRLGRLGPVRGVT